jgi:enamidase
MSHSGGTSIPGSSPIGHEVLLALRPDVCGHVNGGTTSLDDEGLARIVRESPMALQLVQAGNLRSSLRILALARERDALDRIVLATDTPTGTGVMPLGMLKTVCETSSLAGIAATDALALAAGNNGAVLRRPEGVLDVGRPADLSLAFAPLGCSQRDALAAIENGDIPGIGAVVIDGEVRALRSRNTPAPGGECRVVSSLTEVV